MRSVLIVGPDERFGMLFRSYLEKNSWDARWVSDGREALAKWSSFRPDILLTELNGERLDGFEFVNRLRVLAPTLPIVLCTRLAGVQGWSDEVFSALGVQGVLIRPIRFHQGAWMLEQILEAPGDGTESLRLPVAQP